MKKFLMLSLLTVAVSANAGWYEWIFGSNTPELAAARAASVPGKNETLAERRLTQAKSFLTSMSNTTSMQDLNNQYKDAMGLLVIVEANGNSEQKAEAEALKVPLTNVRDNKMASGFGSSAPAAMASPAKRSAPKAPSCKGGSCKR